MTKGVIVRHLLLPGHIQDSKEIIDYLYSTYGNDIYISIMSQYTPMKDIGIKYPELSNKVSQEEYDELVDYAIDIGVENGFIQEGDTADESFIPPFDNEGV
jgi:putative pyruvate formate lyase activating enzyme